MSSARLQKLKDKEEPQLQDSKYQLPTFSHFNEKNSQEYNCLSKKLEASKEDSELQKQLTSSPKSQRQSSKDLNPFEVNIGFDKIEKVQQHTFNQNMMIMNEKDRQQTSQKNQITNTPNQEVLGQLNQQNENVLQIPTSDIQTQSQETQNDQTINTKQIRRRNVIILIVIITCLLSIGLSLYFALVSGGNDKEDPFEKSLYVVQRKFSTQKQQNYKLELHTIHMNQQNSNSSQYSREVVIEYLFSMLIQNQTNDQIQILAFVDQTKQYEVGKPNSTVILTGARNLFDNSNSTNATSTSSQENSSQNQQTKNSLNSSTTDQDQQNSMSDDLPFSDDDINLSRAEIIQFNVTRGGELIDIYFPVNVNETFLFNLPSFLTTLLPNLLKSNYDQIDPKGIKISQKKFNFVQKNAHGAYKMSEMKSLKSATGDITLVQQFVQKTDNDYKQVIQQQSNITFNNQGQLDNSTEDVIQNQQILQKFNVSFINETSISNDERTQIINVYNSMSKKYYNWTDYLIFLDNLKKSEAQLDNTIIISNQTEKSLVDINQRVDLSQPTTRMLTDNNNILESLHVQLFSKNILTIKMQSFISFQCQKPEDNSSNDECKVQIFLQFLGLNIPVSPIQKVNFPLTKYKKQVDWLKKNSLLMMSKIKNNVIDVINKANSQIDAKINLAQNLFSNLSNPILKDVQKYASNMTSSISGQLLDKQQKLQMQYNEILNATQNKVSSIQNIISQSAQQYITTLKNNIPQIQQILIAENQKLIQIYQNNVNELHYLGKLEIQNMQISIQKTHELIQATIDTQIQQNIMKLIQDQQDTFMNSVQSFLNSQSQKLNNTFGQFSLNIQKCILQLMQSSFFNIFSVQLKQMSSQINDLLSIQLGEIQQQFNKTKQQINMDIVKAQSATGKFSNISNNLKPAQNIQDLLEERNRAILETQKNLNTLISRSLDSLKIPIVSNYSQFINITNQEITSKITNVTDIFSNITQQSIIKFRDTITLLKNKTKDFSSNVSQKISDGVDNLFSIVDSYDKQITDQSQQALQMLQADFSQPNFQDEVKKQMGQSAQIITDDISDMSLKSLNLTNLQDGNLLDFPVKSFINGIQDVINNGTDTVQNTVNSVKNVQNSFNDLSNQFKQISQVALNFSQYQNSFLQINKSFQDILNQVDLQNLFQMITDDLKQDLVTFVQSQIIDNIQKQTIDQIKDKFQNLGNMILKANLNKAVKKLENMNKLFEVAITKISSKFQFDKEKKILFDKQLKFPENPWPYFIPTPIGIPLVLQYYFLFGAQISTYFDIQGTSISVGFKISANAEFDASASLSVAVAEVGAYAKGTIIQGDLQGLIRMQLLQKNNLSFIVDGTFKALNLKAFIYIQYIKNSQNSFLNQNESIWSEQLYSWS
ncbi:hypothetical protein ABPG72_013715 [Tetrahymena utriculariae]